MVSVKIYVEGGGDSNSLRSRCREGFRKFLEAAGLDRHMPRIVACGGRQAAYDRFKIACSEPGIALLLIDSEDVVTEESPWTHLARRPGDGFIQPANATDDHCHLMVVCMESWFLADKEALSQFFGPGFQVNALPQNPNIEAVAKNDIYDGLKKASARCKTKAPYGKGDHSFQVLCKIRPDKVVEASPWARRFVEITHKFTAERR